MIVPNIYNARSDIETDAVNVEQFVADISAESGTEAVNGQSLEQAEQMVRDIIEEHDVVVCMGAGDVTKVAERLIA